MIRHQCPPTHHTHARRLNPTLLPLKHILNLHHRRMLTHVLNCDYLMSPSNKLAILQFRLHNNP